MSDILPIPIEAVATHRKIRWPQVTVYNGESSSEKRLEAQAVTVPVRLDGEEVVRVAGSVEHLMHRRVLIQFDADNPKHVQLYTLLEELVKEQDAVNLGQSTTSTASSVPPSIPAPVTVVDLASPAP